MTNSGELRGATLANIPNVSGEAIISRSTLSNYLSYYNYARKVDYATDETGGVFKTGNYIELNSNYRLCQTASLASTALTNTTYDNVLLSAKNVKNLLAGFRKTTIDPNESQIDRIRNFPTTGAVVDYVASVVGDIDSALDAINRRGGIIWEQHQIN